MDQESKLILCPYCGHTQTAETRCQQCGGLFEPLSRKATQIAMGPWFIRDPQRPFRPGCSYEVLVKQIQAGRVKPSTVMRGPTTRQFWSVARHVPGVAHLLGYCHRCGAHVDPIASGCSYCGEPFQPPPERNELGLLYATSAAAEAAQRSLEKEIAEDQQRRAAGGAGLAPNGTIPGAPGGPQPAGAGAGFSLTPGAGGPGAFAGSRASASGMAAPVGADLLSDVLGQVPAPPPPPVTPRPGAITPPAAFGAAGAAPGTAPARGRPSTVGLTPATALGPAAGSASGSGAEGAAESGSESGGEGGLSAAVKKFNLTTWLLIALNVLFGIALVFVVIMVFRGSNNPPPQGPTPPTPPASTTPAPASVPAPGAGHTDAGNSPGAVAAAGDPAQDPAANPGLPATPDPGLNPVVAKLPPSATQPKAAILPPVKAPPDAWTLAMADVDNLEKAGKIPEALAKLRAMRPLAKGDALKLRALDDRLQLLNKRPILFPKPNP